MATGHVLTQAVERIIEPVEAIHQQVARKWFRRTDPVSRPVRFGHNAVAGLVYGAIRIGASVGGMVIDARISEDAGSRMRAIAEGLWGDGLGAPDSGMTLRSADIHSGDAAVTGHLVVLVHGLVETERTWRAAPNGSGFVEELSDRPGLTPILVRYNSGLPIERNGAQLAAMLEALHERWPVPVESVSLVGHSMGGLVARQACVAAHDEGRKWVAHATDLVTIGAPHRGASLETLTGLVAQGLRVASVTRPVAAFLEGRSRGIKDLHTSREEGGELPAQLRKHVIAGVVTADPEHPVGAMVGDLMVTRASSLAAGRSQPTNAAVVGGVHHFKLLADRAVIDQVMSWIDR